MPFATWWESSRDIRFAQYTCVDSQGTGRICLSLAVCHAIARHPVDAPRRRTTPETVIGQPIGLPLHHDLAWSADFKAALTDTLRLCEAATDRPQSGRRCSIEV
jgi:hypothetical protein